MATPLRPCAVLHYSYFIVIGGVVLIDESFTDFALQNTPR